jgi:hypothetical protein
MIKIHFNPFGHWLYDFWKQKEDAQIFIEYAGWKYFFDQNQRDKLYNVCQVVNSRKQFKSEDLRQIQELGIPLGQIDGFNLSAFRERTSPVSYDTFVEYLVSICDNKFTKEQVKQTIENGDN